MSLVAQNFARRADDLPYLLYCFKARAEVRLSAVTLYGQLPHDFSAFRGVLTFANGARRLGWVGRVRVIGVEFREWANSAA